MQAPRVRIDWASKSRLVGLPCAGGTGLPLPTAGDCPVGRYRPDTVYQVIPTKLTEPSLPLTATVLPRFCVRDDIAWVCLYPLQATAQWRATIPIRSRQECDKHLLKFTWDGRRRQIRQSLRAAPTCLKTHLQPVTPDYAPRRARRHSVTNSIAKCSNCAPNGSQLHGFDQLL